jgi:hypothetical protein
MPDSLPQFEITDTAGSTVHVNGPAAVTTAINVPAVATTVIAEIAIANDPTNLVNAKLEISFDGGTNYYPVLRGGTMTWTPKGNMTQVKIKASYVGMKYYVLINLDPP